MRELTDPSSFEVLGRLCSDTRRPSVEREAPSLFTKLIVT